MTMEEAIKELNFMTDKIHQALETLSSITLEYAGTPVIDADKEQRHKAALQKYTDMWETLLELGNESKS